ncbi:MAG: hypothetical protein K6T90_06690 [Leptolyngbyaceae cyanobacterium HOT.MB2.61]|jgi:hypothetical protein|nr:hypothetical protein [Leptolyngbyaceae cyanobacterium HOT.MB2.61]
MASDPNTEPTVVVVNPEENALVETELANQNEAVKQETAALIDAIKKRAQAEIQAAGDLTRETYLNAVRQAREAIEQNQLIERDRIEQSIQQIQHEADKNWHVVLGEIESFGNRLTDAARAAWEKLTEPKA